MKENRVDLIYFSATGTTRTVLENIAKGMSVDEVEHVDLTPAHSDKKTPPQLSGEVAIFGVPVYGGRLPLLAIERLKRFKAEKTPAVLVVVYGNREFEDALLELKNVTSDLGFQPIAGAAFIGEHSFASENTPIANGRPDSRDTEKAREFGAMIRERLPEIITMGSNVDLNLPGSFPYTAAGARPMEVSPTTVKDICTVCGMCETVCPTGAITVSDHVETHTRDCIRCCACIKSCPEGARIINNEEWEYIINWLRDKCSERKEPQFFGV